MPNPNPWKAPIKNPLLDENPNEKPEMKPKKNPSHNHFLGKKWQIIIDNIVIPKVKNMRNIFISSDVNFN